MRKQDKLIDFTTPTEPELSIVEGRNGTFKIKDLRVWESHDRVHVYLQGIGAKRGMTIRGGLRVSLDCFAEACRRFLMEYDAQGNGCELCGYAGPLIHAPGSTACRKRQAEQEDCKINEEGFCETHQKVHLRERAAAMEVPDGEKSVTQEWQMRCPQCCSDESIEISANVYVRLTSEGTDIFDVHNGDHEWDNDSAAYCAGCSFAGTVGDFEIQKEGDAHEV